MPGPRVIASLGAVGLLVAVLSGCSAAQSGDADGSAGHGDHAATSQTAAAAPSSTAGAPNDTGQKGADHNGADVSFTTGMIPHHRQAIVMSDIVLAKQGIDPRVVDLARQIKAAQDPEITTMQQWLTQWGVPESGHEGHDMSGDDMSGDMAGDSSMRKAMGMMTDQELAALRQAQGVDASRQFLDGMIAHHEGAVRMARTEVSDGQSAEAVRLANAIIVTQQREIDTMKTVLGSL